MMITHLLGRISAARWVGRNMTEGEAKPHGPDAGAALQRLHDGDAELMPRAALARARII